MHYEAIHACPNDHVIYYNQHEFKTECLECHISRYQTDQVTKKAPHIFPSFHVCNHYSGTIT